MLKSLCQTYFGRVNPHFSRCGRRTCAGVYSPKWAGANGAKSSRQLLGAISCANGANGAKTLGLFHPSIELVGGLEHEFYFPYIGNNNPN